MTLRLRFGLAASFVALLVAVGFATSIARTSAQQVIRGDGTAVVIIGSGGKLQTARVLLETPDPDRGQPSRPGSIIVQFKPNTSPEDKELVRWFAGAFQSEPLLLDDYERIQVPPDVTALVLKWLRTLPQVQSASADLIAKTGLTPNDPCVASCKPANPPYNCCNYSQWGLSRINAQTAWNTSTGTNARIAILDTGIYEPGSSIFKAPDNQVGHPDLRASKVTARINFSTSSSADDFFNHGTHVAGIAAANTNNGIGVAGVGYNAKLLNVKVLNDNGSGSSTAIINGILWAAGCNTNPCTARRADVINMSLGAQGSCVSVPGLQAAIDKAWSQGVVIVAAAGNAATSAVAWPASCANVIAVGAIQTDNAKASFSNFGSWVDVVAPGTGIVSTDYVGTYSIFSGTSMAAPHVAGIAALVRATSGNLTNSQIVGRIISTANVAILGGSANGLVDAAAAVTGGAPPPPPDTTNPTVTNVTSSLANNTYGVGQTVPVTVTFSEEVNVSGSPRLNLETGTTDRQAVYASGSGNSSLIFNYVVQAGDSSADLDYISNAALVLNGGTIRDAATNDAVLTLANPGASNSLGANKNIVINTTPPPPDTTDPTVTNVTSSLANGTYGVGQTVPVTVTFSEPVIVSGSPRLNLETGATDRQAVYASGSGNSNLVFNYVVQAGDASADLDYISNAALVLNGGTIRDAAINDAVLTLASPGASNSLGANKSIVINTSAPPPPPNTGWLRCNGNARVASSAGDNNGFETNGYNACEDGVGSGGIDNGVANDNDSGTGTGTSCTGADKDKHDYRRYDISIPSGNVVKGIEVRLDAWADASVGVRRMCVQLSWDNGASWTSAKQTAELGTSQASYILGGPLDTWGRTWTNSQASYNNLVVRVIDVSDSTGRDFRLDWVAVRVSYGP